MRSPDDQLGAGRAPAGPPSEAQAYSPPTAVPAHAEPDMVVVPKVQLAEGILPTHKTDAPPPPASSERPALPFAPRRMPSPQQATPFAPHVMAVPPAPPVPSLGAPPAAVTPFGFGSPQGPSPAAAPVTQATSAAVGAELPASPWHSGSQPGFESCVAPVSDSPQADGGRGFAQARHDEGSQLRGRVAWRVGRGFHPRACRDRGGVARVQPEPEPAQQGSNRDSCTVRDRRRF